MIVILAILALIDVATRSSARIATRVEANQRARPVMQRLLDELHSTCIGPDVVPVVAGSTQTRDLIFLQQTGSAVSPTPDEHVVSLATGTLTEWVYPATGGTAPNWTFAATPSSTTRAAHRRRARRRCGEPALDRAPVPVLRLRRGRQLDRPRCRRRLSASDAARTVQVTVSFSVSPRSNPVNDPHAAVSVSDSVVLRLSPAERGPDQGEPPMRMTPRMNACARRRGSRWPRSCWRRCSRLVVVVSAARGQRRPAPDPQRPRPQAGLRGGAGRASPTTPSTSAPTPATGPSAPRSRPRPRSTCRARRRTAGRSPGRADELRDRAPAGHRAVGLQHHEPGRRACSSRAGRSRAPFRIRSTGYSGNEDVSIVATFKRASFLDYVYFTQLETSDPVTYGSSRRSPAPTRSARRPSSRGA